MKVVSNPGFILTSMASFTRRAMIMTVLSISDSGFSFTPFFYFMSLKYVTRKHLPALFTAWLMIQTGSMLYELFEGLITWVMSPQAADDYNGQQGDMWDSQKDMAMALLGSTAMYVAYLLRRFYGKVQSR
jgi:uncharacterized membrane protein YjdF